MLDQRHDYILQALAECLDLPFDEVTDSLLEGKQVWDIIDTLPIVACVGFAEFVVWYYCKITEITTLTFFAVSRGGTQLMIDSLVTNLMKNF